MSSTLAPLTWCMMIAQYAGHGCWQQKCDADAAAATHLPFFLLNFSSLESCNCSFFQHDSCCLLLSSADKVRPKSGIKSDELNWNLSDVVCSCDFFFTIYMYNNNHYWLVQLLCLDYLYAFNSFLCKCAYNLHAWVKDQPTYVNFTNKAKGICNFLHVGPNQR